MECRKYIFYGRVQGVGFRANTATLARRFPVAGTVQNLQDGTVELVTCGEAEDLDLFVKAIQQTFPNFITKIQVDQVPKNFPLNDFRILY